MLLSQSILFFSSYGRKTMLLLVLFMRTRRISISDE